MANLNPWKSLATTPVRNLLEKGYLAPDSGMGGRSCCSYRIAALPEDGAYCAPCFTNSLAAINVLAQPINVSTAALTHSSPNPAPRRMIPRRIWM